MTSDTANEIQRQPQVLAMLERRQLATNCNVCRYAATASLPAPLLWCTMSHLKLVPTYTAWWTEARACKQLAQGCYVVAHRSGFEPATFRSRSRRPTIEPPQQSMIFINRHLSTVQLRVTSTVHFHAPYTHKQLHSSISKEVRHTSHTQDPYHILNLLYLVMYG